MDVPAARWSTLIIRVWLTDGAHLRGRLTELDDVEGPERAVAVVGDAGDVLDATRAWLARVLAAGDN
ncbi:MAG: hypothetical protein ACLQDY_18680 [Streptosporangiaceae bacterium]|jgi:hypothetical protein